jgi:hypothetical protein
MAFYQAKQRKNDDGSPGRWDMTCTDDAGTYGIGYCGRSGSCGGHGTAEEAEACWDKYRLDHDIELYVDSQTQKRCEICAQWTGGRARLRGVFPYEWPLCDEHRNREGIDKANKLAAMRGETLSGEKPWR